MRENIKLDSLPISEKYIEQINSFDCGVKRVSYFLKSEALIMQKNNMAKTRLFYNEKKELVGYFTLSNDIFMRNNKQKLTTEYWDLDTSKCYLAIRLHYIGVDKSYQK